MVDGAKVKNVPRLRFPAFHDGWKKSTLGECTKYTKGFAFKSDDYQEKGIRIVRVSDLGSDNIKHDSEKVFIDLIKGINCIQVIL